MASLRLQENRRWGLGSGKKLSARSLRPGSPVRAFRVHLQQKGPRKVCLGSPLIPMALESSPWKREAASPEVGGLSSRKVGSCGPPPESSTLTPLPQQNEDVKTMWLMPCSRLHDKKPLKHGHCNSENVWQLT